MNILKSGKIYELCRTFYHQISSNFMNLISKPVKQSTSDRCLPFQFSQYSSLWIRALIWLLPTESKSFFQSGRSIQWPCNRDHQDGFTFFGQGFEDAFHFPLVWEEDRSLCLNNRRNRFPWQVEASCLHVCREADYNLDYTTKTLANYVANCRTTQKVPKLKRPRDMFEFQTILHGFVTYIFLVVLQIHFWCSLMARHDPLFVTWQWHLVAPLPCKELWLEALPNTSAATRFRSPAWQVLRRRT